MYGNLRSMSNALTHEIEREKSLCVKEKDREGGGERKRKNIKVDGQERTSQFFELILIRFDITKKGRRKKNI